VAVPLLLAVKLTPVGSAPDSVIEAFAGYPPAANENVPAAPAGNVVEPAVVMAGAWSTVRTKGSLVVPIEFVAVIVRSYTPPLPAVGVPEKAPEPVASANVTPAGKVPLTVIVGAGAPFAVTVMLAAVPATAVADKDDVNTGIVPPTERAKLWVVLP
jgi:hypothetical protein